MFPGANRVPDWIKTSRLQLPAGQDPRLVLLFHFAVQSIIRPNKLRRLLFQLSFKKVITRMKSHLLFRRNIFPSRAEAHAYVCMFLSRTQKRKHTHTSLHTPLDNCWSLNFAVYLQTGCGSTINHHLWQISWGFMQAHEPRPEKSRDWVRHLSAENIFCKPQRRLHNRAGVKKLKETRIFWRIALSKGKAWG